MRHNELVSFDGRDREKRPFGSCVYDFLATDLEDAKSVGVFAKKWHVTKVRRYGEKEGAEAGESHSCWLEVWGTYRVPQSALQAFVGFWLGREAVDAKSGKKAALAITPVQAFSMLAARPAVSAKIKLEVVSVLSPRAAKKRVEALRSIENEILKLPPDPPEEELESLQKKLDSLIARHFEEKVRGQSARATYELADFLSLCWWEVLTAVEKGIPARQCSLCERWFLVSGYGKQTRCLECMANPSPAWRKKPGSRFKTKVARAKRKGTITQQQRQTLLAAFKKEGLEKAEDMYQALRKRGHRK